MGNINARGIILDHRGVEPGQGARHHALNAYRQTIRGLLLREPVDLLRVSQSRPA